MRISYDKEADFGLLIGKTVGVIGYGSPDRRTGPAQHPIEQLGDLPRGMMNWLGQDQDDH